MENLQAVVDEVLGLAWLREAIRHLLNQCSTNAYGDFCAIELMRNKMDEIRKGRQCRVQLSK